MKFDGANPFECPMASQDIHPALNQKKYCIMRILDDTVAPKIVTLVDEKNNKAVVI